MSVVSIWSNAGLPSEAVQLLRESIRPHALTLASQPAESNLVASPVEGALLDAEVVFGQPDPAALIASSKLRLVHLTSAGYTRYDTDEFRQAMQRRGARLTTSSSVYAGPCAEHVLAMMLGIVRQLPASHDTQRTSRAWPMVERRIVSRLVSRQSVVLLGYGAIARRLAELLLPFGSRVTAFRRSVQAADRPAHVTFVDEDGLDAALRDADHVVDLLPESPSTLAFVDAARLSRMKPGAAFYNVGRGSTVEQDALIEALRSNHLGAAYLDVTTPEPLPIDHPLWSAPRCFITPHTAGGQDDEHEHLVRHFVSNLTAFVNGQPLKDRVI